MSLETRTDRSAALLPEQCLLAWMEITDASEELLLAGLRREVGPQGDWLTAYRRWYEERMREHDRTLAHILKRLAACQHDCQTGLANPETRLG